MLILLSVIDLMCHVMSPAVTSCVPSCFILEASGRYMYLPKEVAQLRLVCYNGNSCPQLIYVYEIFLEWKRRNTSKKDLTWSRLHYFFEKNRCWVCWSLRIVTVAQLAARIVMLHWRAAPGHLRVAAASRQLTEPPSPPPPLFLSSHSGNMGKIVEFFKSGGAQARQALTCWSFALALWAWSAASSGVTTCQKEKT